MPGRPRSSTSRSTCPTRTRSSAATPSTATSTSYPSRCSARDSGSAMAVSSSASRTVVIAAELRPPAACSRAWTPISTLALRLADAADAITLPRFRAADLRVEPQARPHPRHRRRHRRRGRAARRDRRRAPGRRRARRGARRRRRRGRPRLGARPDRRHEELLPRHAGVGHADRAHRATARPWSGWRARPRWAGGGGRRAGTGPGRRTTARAGRSAAPHRRVRGRPTSATRTSPPPTCARSDSRAGCDRYLRLVDACWETRAFGDFWQHCLVAEGVLDVAVDAAANPWDLAALVPIVVEAGGRAHRPHRRGRLRRAATGSRPTAPLHDAALAIVGR